MSEQAKGSIEIGDWDEDAYVQIDDDRKLTRAVVAEQFHGDIEGASSVTWLMAYREDGTADFLGFQRIEGMVGSREGSIVLRTEGSFDGKVAAGPLTVVEGSGTGALEGMTGSGTMTAPMTGTPEYELEYDFG